MFIARRVITLAVLVRVLVHAAPASAEGTARPPERGVPLMATGAALFGTSYAISLAIGVHATADYIGRCSNDGPRPWAEAFACISPPSTMHLMVPIAGPFRALAETRDDSDKAILVADGIAQITGVVLAGIGMAQYIDGRSSGGPPAKSSFRIVPRGGGLGLVGTF